MKSYKIFLLGIMMIILLGCKKNFLDAKPDQSLLVPQTVKDMQALLDNNSVMNTSAIYPHVSSDDFSSVNPVLTGTTLGSYTWSEDIWGIEVPVDWNRQWAQIFYANVILDGLDKNEPLMIKDAAYDEVKGGAYFFRAIAYFNLLQQFSGPYLSSTAGLVEGMPLRLISDINKNPERSKLNESYNQVIRDLTNASQMLPKKVLFKTRPSKSAAFAALARVYLTMNDFSKAEENASFALDLNPLLLDFNSLIASAARPLPKAVTVDNPEVLFFSRTSSSNIFNDATTIIADSLYNSYSSDDLRKIIYFDTSIPSKVIFKGSFSGTSEIFTGFANDELYLIRAECRVRNNKSTLALEDLNTLLLKRYKTGKYVAPVAANEKDLLNIILKERNKELLYRGTRWSDLRRLNIFDKRGYILTRTYGGKTYYLLPNSEAYTFPIPPNEISLSGIK